MDGSIHLGVIVCAFLIDLHILLSTFMACTGAGTFAIAILAGWLLISGGSWTAGAQHTFLQRILFCRPRRGALAA